MGSDQDSTYDCTVKILNQIGDEFTSPEGSIKLGLHKTKQLTLIQRYKVEADLKSTKYQMNFDM